MTSSLSRSTGNIVRARENEQRLISQLKLRRNSVLLKLKATEKGEGADLQASRQHLEDLAKELDRHLATVNDLASSHSNATTNAQTKKGTTRRVKRPAPSPPARYSLVTTTNSSPDLPNLDQRIQRHGAFSPSSSRPARHHLKKSLSLTGSRNLLNAVLSTLKGTRSSRRELEDQSLRDSKSHEYLDLAPLDQEQYMANAAAVRAQLRRGTISSVNTRSLSAEPRRHNPTVGHGGDPSPKKPHDSSPKKAIERLFLPGQANKTPPARYVPKSPSPVPLRHPQTPHKPPTGFKYDVDGLAVSKWSQASPRALKLAYKKRYHVAGVSKAALDEIEAFEQLIENYFLTQASLPERL